MLAPESIIFEGEAQSLDSEERKEIAALLEQALGEDSELQETTGLITINGVPPRRLMYHITKRARLEPAQESDSEEARESSSLGEQGCEQAQASESAQADGESQVFVVRLLDWGIPGLAEFLAGSTDGTAVIRNIFVPRIVERLAEIRDTFGIVPSVGTAYDIAGIIVDRLFVNGGRLLKRLAGHDNEEIVEHLGSVIPEFVSIPGLFNLPVPGDEVPPGFLRGHYPFLIRQVEELASAARITISEEQSHDLVAELVLKLIQDKDAFQVMHRSKADIRLFLGKAVLDAFLSGARTLVKGREPAETRGFVDSLAYSWTSLSEISGEYKRLALMSALPGRKDAELSSPLEAVLCHDMSDDRFPPYRHLCFKEMQLVLAKAIAQLKPNYREALLMKSNDMSYADIARKLGQPESTVTNWIRRARQALLRDPKVREFLPGDFFRTKTEMKDRESEQSRMKALIEQAFNGPISELIPKLLQRHDKRRK